MVIEILDSGAVNLKTAGTTLSTTFAVSADFPVGTLIVVGVVFDNTAHVTGAAPTCTIAHNHNTDPNGTAFTERALLASPVTSAGGAMRLGLFEFEVGVDWLSSGPSRTITATFGASITAKSLIWFAVKNVSFKEIAYSGIATTGAALSDFMGPDFNGQAGILLGAVEGNSAPAPIYGTPLETPNQTITQGTTGQSAVTNVFMSMNIGVLPWVSTPLGIPSSETRDKAFIFLKFNDKIPPASDIQKIAIGDTLLPLDKLYIGSNKVNRVYVGTVMVYDDV